MPTSYAIIGASRGIGLEYVTKLVSIAYSDGLQELIQQLSVSPGGSS